MDSDLDQTMEKVPIMISKNLYGKLEKGVKLSNNEFKSVEEYITFLLSEVVKAQEDRLENDNEFSKEEDEEIKGRLKTLGYI